MTLIYNIAYRNMSQMYERRDFEDERRDSQDYRFGLWVK